MDLKDRIKDIRKKKKWSQIDLSKRSGISAGMIGGIENGTRNPSKKTLLKLANTLNVSAEWLESGKDNSDCMVEDFLKRLVDEGIVKSPNLDTDIKNAILNVVEAQLALLLKKKEL